MHLHLTNHHGPVVPQNNKENDNHENKETMGKDRTPNSIAFFHESEI